DPAEADVLLREAASIGQSPRGALDQAGQRELRRRHGRGGGLLVVEPLALHREGGAVEFKPALKRGALVGDDGEDGTVTKRAPGQPDLAMLASISSVLKARSVLERMLPSAPTWSRAAVAVSSSGKSTTVTRSYSPTVHSSSRILPPAPSASLVKSAARLGL